MLPVWYVKYTFAIFLELQELRKLGLGLAVLTIFIRSVFRVAELSGGFNGKLFNEQIPFMILEGPMIIIACTAMSTLHPGIAFQGSWHEADFIFWRKITFRNQEMITADEKPSPAISDEESGIHTRVGEVEEGLKRK